MLARWLRWLTFVELAGAGLIAWAWIAADGHWAAGLTIGLLTPLAVHGGVIALGFMQAHLARSPTPGEYRLSLIGSLALFLREWRDSVVAFQITQPWFAPRPLAGEDGTGQPDRVPVLLIHGFLCNRQLWRPLARWLAARGHAVGAVDLEPVLGSIDDYLPLIEREVRALLARTGAPGVALIGHSMGGLAARAWLRRYGTRRVRALITIGTPHQGTAHARLGLGANARQMRLASAWLAALAADEAAAGAHALPPTTVILSHHDNIVAPQAPQTLPQAAATRTLGGVGHLSLVYDREVWAMVARELASVREGAPAPADA